MAVITVTIFDARTDEALAVWDFTEANGHALAAKRVESRLAEAEAAGRAGRERITVRVVAEGN